MDGIHDLGGMHGFGPVEADPAERGFHAPWEPRSRIAAQSHMTGRKLPR